jgi:hypothetical protein
MEPLRFTRVVGVMAVFLGIAAIVLNDPAFCLAAFSLVLFSAALALRFLVRIHRISRSARVRRTLSRPIVSQGGTTAITTSFSCSPEPGTAVLVRDLYPPATIRDPADPAIDLAPNGTATMGYLLTPLVPGSAGVAGIELIVFDPFWTASLVMASAPFRGPELKVFPHTAGKRLHYGQDFDVRDRDPPIIYRGSGVRSVREYQHGDEIRFIDWKMTAKHDRMFVRDYTAAETIPPLVILDLPDRSFPVPDELMARLVSRVSDEAATGLRSSGLISLVLISGVNVVDMLLAEPDMRRVSMMIRQSAHPQFRLYHAYRWKSRAGMRDAIRMFGSAAFQGNEDRFPARITRVYRRNLSSRYVPLFSRQIYQLLSPYKVKEVILYSLFSGDLSHVREIAFQARMQGVRLKLRTTAGQDPARITAIRNLQGMDTLEVIAE